MNDISRPRGSMGALTTPHRAPSASFRRRATIGEETMKPPPAAWPRMSASVYYLDPLVAIDWLTNAFGFDVRMKIVGDDGKLAHSELTFGDAVIMVGAEG